MAGENKLYDESRNLDSIYYMQFMKDHPDELPPIHILEKGLVRKIKGLPDPIELK